VKLRTALKIWNAIGGPRDGRYSNHQKDLAHRRVERMRSSRESHAFWNGLMEKIGVRGRVRILKDRAPGLAFGLMMKTPEEEWR
jgi:hypothetical protein